MSLYTDIACHIPVDNNIYNQSRLNGTNFTQEQEVNKTPPNPQNPA